jgi:predicted aspartyl protease
MIQGWLREDGQAVVDFEVVCSDRSSHTVPAIIDTGFNGQESLSRRVVDELDLPLTMKGQWRRSWRAAWSSRRMCTAARSVLTDKS